MRVFVPVEDDFVPETALLVPYRAGMECWHALGDPAFEWLGDGDQRCTIISSPEVKPSLAA